MKFRKKRLASVSLGDRVYNDLRIAILTGRIASDNRLSESTLAREMGVSRTPVREALQKLKSENLVRSIPRVGYMVNDISEYDIEDLFTTRAAIEQLTGRWAAEKINAEELDLLEENLRKTDQILRNGAMKKMIDLDTEFHEIICKASRSRRLYQINQMLREHMLKLRMTCLCIPEIAQKGRDDHFRILKAIKERNPQEIENAMLSHMVEAKKDFWDYVRKLSGYTDYRGQ